MLKAMESLQVFVYLFLGRQEETLPNWDKIQKVEGFEPHLHGKFRDMFVVPEQGVKIFFVGGDELRRKLYKYQQGAIIGYAPPKVDFINHAVMTGASEISWKPGDWVFKLILTNNGQWMIQGGQYRP